jgi:hypothetical protein
VRDDLIFERDRARELLEEPSLVDLAPQEEAQQARVPAPRSLGARRSFIR